MLARQAFAPYLGPLCRGLSTSGASFARHANSVPSPKSRDHQQPHPGKSIAVSNETNEVGPTAEQWAQVTDKPSGQIYYWNQQTGANDLLQACNEILPAVYLVGFLAVQLRELRGFVSCEPMPDASRGIGSPCIHAGETTALGEPKPGPLGRVQNRVVPAQSAGAGSSLLGMVAAGAGIGLVFSVIGRIL